MKEFFLTLRNSDFISSVAVVALLVCIIWFVRKLRQTQAALENSQTRLNLALRSSGVGVWSWEISQNLITSDENCCLLFGVPNGQFARTIEEFATMVHSDDRERVQREFNSSLKFGTEYNTEYRVVWPEPAVRYIAARGRLNHDDQGRPFRVSGVCWDVTDRRLAEEKLRESNAKLTQSLGKLERRKEEGAILREMADLLQSCSSSAEAYEIVARFGGHLFSAYAGALYIYNSSRNLVQSVTTWNNPVISETPFAPDDCWALRRGHTHIIETGHFATPCRHLTDNPGGHACLPLMAQGKGLGILYLQERNHNNKDPVEEFLAADERQLANTVAERVGLSLANLYLQEALRLQSFRDPLTGLFNRRYLEESLERELFTLARRQQPAGFVMLDLDHFKNFNDTFGHEGGDAVLREFGIFLRDHLRKGDIACRYGGEEFCILLCETSLENTVRRIEQLREEFKQMSVLHSGQNLGGITMSFGVSCFPMHGTTMRELIAAADAALYQAKSEGRDRIITATVMPSV